MTREIILTGGHVATVDEEDYAALAGLRWFFVPKATKAAGGYAYRTVRQDGRPTTLLMHRAILQPPKGVPIDHINGDGLDNRRANLRLSTASMNGRNCPARSKWGFKGVRLVHGRFAADFYSRAGDRYLGIYDTAEEAARVVDAYALALLGSSAWLNFPPPGHEQA